MSESDYRLVRVVKVGKVARAISTLYLTIVPFIVWFNWDAFTSLPLWMWLWLLFMIMTDWIKTLTVVLSGDESWR